MDQNNWKEMRQKVQKQLSENEQELKSITLHLEEYNQVSKDGKAFLQETAELFRSSSESGLFSGILEEQSRLDKKIVSQLEKAQEDLVREQRKLLEEQKELDSHHKQEEI